MGVGGTLSRLLGDRVAVGGRDSGRFAELEANLAELRTIARAHHLAVPQASRPEGTEDRAVIDVIVKTIVGGDLLPQTRHMTLGGV